jgi:hypothetical protein
MNRNEEKLVRGTSEIGLRELDFRSNDGIDVTLLWDPRTNQLFVAVEDERHGDSFELVIDPADALDAFRHPYAFVRRVDDDDALPARPAPQREGRR